VTASKPAVIDANVLFSATIRDLLIRCHIAGVIRIHWTSRILDEVFTAIERERPGLEPARLQRTRDLMNRGARGADITELVDEDFSIDETLAPDVNDLHVVRAAVGIGADIVTWNLADFPPRLLEPLGIKAVSPDEFLTTFVESNVDTIRQVIERQAADLVSPPTTVHMLAQRFEVLGLRVFVRAIRLE
jgi:PIN domain